MSVAIQVENVLGQCLLEEWVEIRSGQDMLKLGALLDGLNSLLGPKFLLAKVIASRKFATHSIRFCAYDKQGLLKRFGLVEV